VRLVVDARRNGCCMITAALVGSDALHVWTAYLTEHHSRPQAKRWHGKHTSPYLRPACECCFVLLSHNMLLRLQLINPQY